MDEKKLIEELTADIESIIKFAIDRVGAPPSPHMIAVGLYNKGYRSLPKATEAYRSLPKPTEAYQEQAKEILKDICPFYKDYGSCDRCRVDDFEDDEPCYWECIAREITRNGYVKMGDK